MLMKGNIEFSTWNMKRKYEQDLENPIKFLDRERNSQLKKTFLENLKQDLKKRERERKRENR